MITNVMDGYYFTSATTRPPKWFRALQIGSDTKSLTLSNSSSHAMCLSVKQIGTQHLQKTSRVYQEDRWTEIEW
jgi:hypothetical protein